MTIDEILAGLDKTAKQANDIATAIRVQKQELTVSRESANKQRQKLQEYREIVRGYEQIMDVLGFPHIQRPV